LPDAALPAPPDLFDLPRAADPSPRAAALLAPLPALAADLVQEARPGYADPPPPFYASPDGRLRLYQADALELLRRMREESVDMIFADPPYFLSNGGITCVGGRMVRVDKGGWDKSQGIIGDHNFNLLWLDQCRRILKPNGTLWVTGTSHNIHSVGYGLQVLGYKILNDIAWYKVNPPPNLACRYFTHATETILWAAKSAQSRHTFHYPLMKEQNGGKQMQSLWSIMPPGKSEKRHGKHPTQKPEALLTRIVAASTNPDELVLDPFCGSATTGVACARLGRRFIGIEREQEFLALAINRLAEEVQQVALVFVFTGAPMKRDQTGREREWNGAITWNDIVSYALTTLGGEGDLKEINRVVESNPRTLSNPTWTSTIRRVVRQSARISAVGRGRYRLWQN
jgi:site-specific DNA-methyltransferase (adenine-specific)